MEEQGVTAIAIVTTPFRNTGKAMAESWGKPVYPFLDMPHPIANLTEAQLDERCDRLAEQGEEWLGVGAHQRGPPPLRPAAPPARHPRDPRARAPLAPRAAPRPQPPPRPPARPGS